MVAFGNVCWSVGYRGCGAWQEVVFPFGGSCEATALSANEMQTLAKIQEKRISLSPNFSFSLYPKKEASKKYPARDTDSEIQELKKC
jgi:hypothetical protein